MDKRRIIMVLLTIVMAVPTMAQYSNYRHTTPRQQHNYSREDNDVYYGLRLGLAVSTVNSDDERLDGGNSKAGLNVGAALGYQLSSSAPIYLETGLYYTEKGGKGQNDNKKFTYSLHYLELPILIKYRCELDYDMSLQPFVGGYLALGVGGKIKNYDEREIYSSFSDNFFKRFDGGLRIGCGFEWQHLYADLSYEFGLANICHDYFDTSRNGTFYLNVGVNF